jgi:hypothetical protein
MGGVFYSSSDDLTLFTGTTQKFVAATTTQIYSGHYLVQSTVVPVLAAVWLFGSGLIGLIGMARRKKA